MHEAPRKQCRISLALALKLKSSALALSSVVKSLVLALALRLKSLTLALTSGFSVMRVQLTLDRSTPEHSRSGNDFITEPTVSSRLFEQIVRGVTQCVGRHVDMTCNLCATKTS